MIADYIRQAKTEYEIYFLLTAYIQTVRFCDKMESMPEQMAALPLSGKADLQARFNGLIVDLDVASKRLDDNACVVIKEALVVLSTALNRLWTIDNKRRWPHSALDKKAALSWSPIPLTESASRTVGKLAVSNTIPLDPPPAPAGPLA